jgi:hypothetical protein
MGLGQHYLLAGVHTQHLHLHRPALVPLASISPPNVTQGRHRWHEQILEGLVLLVQVSPGLFSRCTCLGDTPHLRPSQGNSPFQQRSSQHTFNNSSNTISKLSSSKKWRGEGTRASLEGMRWF